MGFPVAAPSFHPDPRFLPMTRAEMEARGWDAVDVVFVTGDAYIDHYSFAMAILGRVLERAGRLGPSLHPDGFQGRSCGVRHGRGDHH